MKEGLLKSLPEPEHPKTGWPWNKEFDMSSYKGFSTFPKISVVIPSYNQGNFIEETLRTILLQNYPNLEVIVIDGGSTDDTINVIRKYEKWITYWVSEKDRGQSHAINKGFERANGDLVVWQNSDDLSSIGAFYQIANAYHSNPSADVYFGHAELIDQNSKRIYTLYYVPFSFFELKYCGWNITNQSCFFRNSLIKEINLNESYHYAMDGDFFFRIAAAGKKFKFINKVLGQFRLHDSAKTNLINNTIGKEEWISIRERHNIPMSESEEWSKQYLPQKFICRARKYFYYFRYGILLKKLQNR